MKNLYLLAFLILTPLAMWLTNKRKDFQFQAKPLVIKEFKADKTAKTSVTATSTPLSQLMAAPLFDPLRGDKPPVTEKPVEDAKAEEKAEVEIKLQAIIAIGNRRAARLAINTTNNRRPTRPGQKPSSQGTLVFENEMFADTGYLLKTVGKNGVTLTKSDAEPLKLELDFSSPTHGATRVPSPPVKKTTKPTTARKPTAPINNTSKNK